MFNLLFSIHELFLLSVFSFFSILLIKNLFFKKIIYIFLYHTCLFFIVLIAALGGAGVQNKDYKSLETLITLEKNNQLEEAKKHPEKYGSDLYFALTFNNSSEFSNYIRQFDVSVDRAEATFIGWFFAFIGEISFLIARLLTFIYYKIKRQNHPSLN